VVVGKVEVVKEKGGWWWAHARKVGVVEENGEGWSWTIARKI